MICLMVGYFNFNVIARSVRRGNLMIRTRKKQIATVFSKPRMTFFTNERKQPKPPKQRI